MRTICYKIRLGELGLTNVHIVASITRHIQKPRVHKQYAAQTKSAAIFDGFVLNPYDSTNDNYELIKIIHRNMTIKSRRNLTFANVTVLESSHKHELFSNYHHHHRRRHCRRHCHNHQQKQQHFNELKLRLIEVAILRILNENANITQAFN